MVRRRPILQQRLSTAEQLRVLRARREGDDELLGRLAGEFGFDGDVDGLVAAVAAERGEGEGAG
jgi:hypothetical protein